MRTIILVLVLLSPVVALADPTCGTITTDITATDRSTATIAYTRPAVSNPTLVVAVTDRHPANTVSTVTYAGVSMTKKLSLKHSTDVTASAWFYLKSPASGTNNVVVTWPSGVLASGVFIATCADTHSDADPFRNAGVSAENIGTAVSVTATDSSGDVTLDAMSIDSNSVAPTVGANQTSLFAAAAGSEMAMGVSQQSGGLGGVMSWTANSSNGWVTTAVPLRQFPTTSFLYRRRFQ